MKVQSINNTMQSRNSHNTTNKKIPHSSSYNNFSNSINPKSVSFGGIGTFFNALTRKSKTVAANLPEKVMEELSKKEFGAYALTEKGYVPITPKEFKDIDADKASELIIKQGLSTSEVTTGSLDGKFETTTYKYRKGICPTSIIAYVEKGFSKVTTVVDDGLQVLTIPEAARKSQKIIDKLEKTEYPDRQAYETIYMMPEAVPEYWYDLSKKMVTEVRSSGITLEKIPN